jgi:hypothetical protein
MSAHQLVSLELWLQWPFYWVAIIWLAAFFAGLGVGLLVKGRGRVDCLCTLRERQSGHRLDCWRAS